MVVKRCISRVVLAILFIWAAVLYTKSASADLLLVEGDFNYPPYEYLDNGIPSGFNVDIIRAVARAEHLDIKINLRKWTDVVEDLEKGKCNIVMGMFRSSERAQKFDFSIPHNIISHSVFVRNDSPIKSLDDLNRAEIIVQHGDIMHEFASKRFPETVIVPVPSQEDALRLLASGKHDAVLAGKLLGLFKLGKAGVRNVVPVGPGFESGEYGFAVRKGETRLLGMLNEGLSLIRNSGEYDRIYNKWFSTYEARDRYALLGRYVVMVSVPLLAALLLFMAWTWLLRKRVVAKTEELVDELNERKKVEDELLMFQNYLSSVIDSMPSMLIGVDKDCNINQWNQEAEKVTGMESNAVMGISLDIAVPYLANTMDNVREALKSGEMHVESKVKRYEGGVPRYEDIIVFPLQGREIEGAVIRIDDITERMNFEHMVVQSEKMMSIGGLAAGMAHEINNPLAVIVGQAQNIRRRTSGEIKKNITVAEECGTNFDSIRRYMQERGVLRMLDGIVESGNRAAKIVVNMLSFSRDGSGFRDEHDLAELLDRTVELASSDYNLKKEYDFKQIEIFREYDLNISPVYCEGNEIQQVFLNIIRNGAEAMAEKRYPVGGPRFILRVKQAGEMIRIEIEDNGPGMEESVIKRIFDPFFTTKEVGKGTGLGMSVSYFIITEHHHGIIEVASMFGHWTRFTIRLPAQDKK